MNVEIVELSWNAAKGCFEEAPVKYTKTTDRFIQLGQVPLDWLEEASQLPGKALAVGLVIWALAIAVKNKTVMVAPSSVRGFAVDAAAKSRALSALAKAGLISLDRRKGKFPLVTLGASDET